MAHSATAVHPIDGVLPYCIVLVCYACLPPDPSTLDFQRHFTEPRGQARQRGPGAGVAFREGR